MKGSSEETKEIGAAIAEQAHLALIQAGDIQAAEEKLKEIVEKALETMPVQNEVDEEASSQSAA